MVAFSIRMLNLGTMNVNSPHTVKSKDEHKAFVEGRNVKEGMDGDKIAVSAKWFQLPSFSESSRMDSWKESWWIHFVFFGMICLVLAW